MAKIFETKKSKTSWCWQKQERLLNKVRKLQTKMSYTL